MEKFNHIYQAHHPVICRYVSGFLPGSSQVPDVVQEVFVRLYVQMQAGVEIEFPKTWLYRVATNECMNRLSRRREKQSLEELHEASLGHDNSLEADMEAADNRRMMRKALDKMKASDRTLLVLYSEGLSYKEIADISGVKFSSVGKSLSRALEKLKDILNKDGYEMSY